MVASTPERPARIEAVIMAGVTDVACRVGERLGIGAGADRRT